MNRKTFLNIWKIPSLALAMVALSASPSFAQVNVDLAAVSGEWTPPDRFCLDGTTACNQHTDCAAQDDVCYNGPAIAMWGFITDPGSCPGSPVSWSVGPTLTATAGGSLTVNVRNCLSEPVSIFIPGQLKATSPVTFPDGQGRDRVRSFDAETAPNTVESYTWAGVKEGTYLYHSGTHPQVQVQMGLYGALVVTGGSYPPYAQDQVLVYSEIDPDLHAAVALDDYGPGKGTTSTFDYNPRYFLINGKFFDKGDPNTNDIAVDVSANVLLRFVNAGLKTHVPTLGGGLYMSLIAEDGNLAPPEPVRLQYGVELSAGKTFDALLNVGSKDRYALYDRALNLGNNSAIDGGMLIYIDAGAVAGAPTALDDAYATDEDTLLTVVAPGVLDNDTADPVTDPMTASLVSDVSAGALVLAPDGSFTYAPTGDFNGTDIFTYQANDGLGGPNSNVATVTITVTAVNDGPVANPDAYDAVEGQPLMVDAPGVLGNDGDVDGDGMTAAQTGIEPPGTLALNGDGSFAYTPAGLAGAVETFDYEACDVPPMPPEQICSTTTVTITVVPAGANTPPLANDDFAEVVRNSDDTFAANTFSVTANDVDLDLDGTIDPTTVVITTGASTQRNGTVVQNDDGTVTFTPKKGFRGTDTFKYTVNDDAGDTSNEATVRVNVVK